MYPPLATVTVVTTPAGVTMRTQELLESATQMLPVLSTVRPLGALNLAPAPVPSTKPTPEAVPAKTENVVGWVGGWVGPLVGFQPCELQPMARDTMAKPAMRKGSSLFSIGFSL